MIRSVAIVGMGALGLLYANQITEGLGDLVSVSFVMDDERLKRHENDIYTINGVEKKFQMVSETEAQPVDLVMIAVKYNALPKAIETMKNLVGENTRIMSVMNGVTSEKMIAERYGMDRMIYTVAQGMDAMRDGSSLVFTQCGALHIGVTDENRKENLDEIRDLFERAKVPHVVEEDILYRLWFKYMLNVGVNQTCMVFDTNYGVATTPGEEAYEKMVGAMREVLEIACKKGITLTEADLLHTIEIEKTLDPLGYPSMAQDRKAGRKSEVDMFAGEVIKMGKELGIPTPFNQFFAERVAEIEKDF